MSIDNHPMTGRFLQGRLRHAMADREKDLIEGLILKTEELRGEQLLLKRGDFCDYSTMLIEGLMLRTIHEDGRRSIVGYQVPGDFVDLHAFALKRLDHDLMVIGNVTVGYVPHERLNEIMKTESHLARIFWFSTLLDAAIHREWIMKSQQLRSMGRLAHLLAELWYRLRMVELGSSNGFQTPLNQIHLGEICGMSTVHVNRCLRDLREAGIVEFRRGRITVLDAEKLKETARFEPSYLYGEGGLSVGHALDKGAGETLPVRRAG